jgi:hypothetical protein
LDGFNEVLALGGPDNGRATPASFTPEPANEPQRSSTNGETG